MAIRAALMILFSLAAAATPALADTYKWVDSKGVTNYSNKPPPESAGKSQLVEERLSIVAPDPALAREAAAMRERLARRAQYDEADYLRRQHAMAARQSYPGTGPNCPYGTDCATGYRTSSYYPSSYYPAYAYPYYARSVFVAGVPTRPSALRSHFPSGGRGMARSGRSALR